jgi:DNA-binding LytR/AlgR family response regulator
MSPDPHFVREHFHPLEVIPFFRRYPRTVVRDLVYTFIWSCLFGLVFYAMGAFTGGRMPSFRVLGIYLLISNFIGYSIHLLFDLGSVAGLDLACRRAGLFAKVVYFTSIPLLGVLLGLWLSSFVVDVGLGSILGDPGALLSLAAVSVVISFVLSGIFFWRERSAVADAALARERERSERIEREAVTANLRALQAQIEPHFLFNTLANVTSLVDSDPAKAKHMLASFNRFLRASLAATRTESTTLGADAELIAAYLDVLQVRMGKRLAWRIDVPPELSGFAIPPMLVQPVVENAIRHGLEPKVDGGEVTLSARREDGGVRIDGRRHRAWASRPPRAAAWGLGEPARPAEAALWRARLARHRRQPALRHARVDRHSGMSARALIADDEANLAEHLRARLAALWPELEVLPLAANGLEALRAIEEDAPEIAFLDIRMPGLTGLDVARRIEARTHVVFVTAYDQYAVEAFDRDAVDYLLKPVTDERLERAIERLRAKLARPRSRPRWTRCSPARARASRRRAGQLRWIRALKGEVVQQIAVDDVLYFQASDKYTCVITRAGESLIRMPLAELASSSTPRSSGRSIAARWST